MPSPFANLNTIFLIIKIKIVKLFNPPNDKPKKQLLKEIKPYPMLRKWQRSKPIERLKVLQLLQVFSFSFDFP